jgi:hypothetical protein
MIQTARKPKFINPPNKLKAKVGGGGISPERLKQAQEYINNNAVDFIPHATSFLDLVTELAKEARNSRSDFDRNKLAQPIMQLKANGGMFRYQLISNVADICLQFVEAIQEINDDAYDVILAHVNTISIIINNQMTGNGGKEGKALIKELENACKRYLTKHQKGE